MAMPLTFPCIDEQTVETNWMPAPNPSTLNTVEIASPFANKSLRLPSLANEEYIGNLVALAATTAIPCRIKTTKFVVLSVIITNGGVIFTPNAKHIKLSCILSLIGQTYKYKKND